MERIATTTLRRTCRSAVLSSSSTQRARCIASRTCAARSLCLNSSSSHNQSSLPIDKASQLPNLSSKQSLRIQRIRKYSTEGGVGASSSVQGEKGIDHDAVRERVRLAAPEHLNEKEAEIFGKLAEFFEPTELEVQDISGGCGSMYGISITSEKFRGLGMLKQQRLVNGVLGEEIKEWHGVQLRTRVP